MNTLPRAITSVVLSDERIYTALRDQWSTLVRSEHNRELTAAHYLLYLALLGRDWRTAFTPLSNVRKLENGSFHAWALFRALRIVQSPWLEADLLAPFDGLITSKMLERLRVLLPKVTPHSHSIEAYAVGVFPFAAYTVAVANEPVPAR